MADVDLSKYSTEQLEQMLSGTGMDPVVSSAGQAAPATPNVATDIAHSVGPALARGAMKAATIPGDVFNLGLWGAQKGTDWLGGEGNPVSQTIEATRKMRIEPTTYDARMQQLQKDWPGVNTQAQTRPGQYISSGVEAVPQAAAAALTGGESAVPALAKGFMSGMGSQAGGELADQYFPPWAKPYMETAGALAGWGSPATLRRGITPNPADPARNALANRLADQGIPVSAADRSGSRFWSTLEGGPPSGQSQAIDSVLRKAGGIERPPGSDASTLDLIRQRQRDLSARAEQLVNNTFLPVNQNLNNRLSSIVQAHNNQFQGTTLESPELNNALQDFQTFTRGTGRLTGQQYQALSQGWGSSPNPSVRAMGKELDAAMDATPYGPHWAQWRDDYANFSGAKAAAESLGEKSTVLPLDPGKVAGGTYRDTPAIRTAHAADAITGTRAEPYALSDMAGPGAALSTAGALLGAGLGHTEPYTAGILGGMMAPIATGAGLWGVSKFGRSMPMQAWGSNQRWLPGPYTSLDPQTAARLLAIENTPQTPE